MKRAWKRDWKKDRAAAAKHARLMRLKPELREALYAPPDRFTPPERPPASTALPRETATKET